MHLETHDSQATILLTGADPVLDAPPRTLTDRLGAPTSRKSGILSAFTDRLGAPILQNFADNQKGKGAKTRFLRARHQKCGLLLRGIGAR